MRVYDYLSLCLLQHKDFLVIYDYLKNNFGITNLKEDFYNLPFTPELITKFFKGWKINEQKYYTEYKNNNFLIVFNKAKKHYFLGHNNLDTELEKFVYPLILNDFLRDCIKCNIELEM